MFKEMVPAIDEQILTVTIRLGRWTIPRLLRHSASHVALDQTGNGFCLSRHSNSLRFHRRERIFLTRISLLSTSALAVTLTEDSNQSFIPGYALMPPGSDSASASYARSPEGKTARIDIHS